MAECTCPYPDPVPADMHRGCPAHGEIATAWASVHGRLPESEPPPLAASILRKLISAGRGGVHDGRLYLSEQEYDEGIRVDLAPEEAALLAVIASENT